MKHVEFPAQLPVKASVGRLVLAALCDLWHFHLLVLLCGRLCVCFVLFGSVVAAFAVGLGWAAVLLIEWRLY